MNVERLQALASRLDVLPREKFDLCNFDTATTCCTMCVAMNMPEFNLVGYTSYDTGYDGRRPQYKEFSGGEAFARFFGLARDDMRGLCGMDYKRFNLSYKDGPERVAAAIRKLIATKRAKHEERQSEASVKSSAETVSA